MSRVFLVHGWDGRPDNHWFPWLRMELIARGWEVNAPQLPNAAQPKVKEWLGFLKDYVGKPDAETYFVGHSLGCITIARYLAELSPKQKVGGCVFVAGFSGRLHISEIREFYLSPHQTQQTHIDTSKLEVCKHGQDVTLEKNGKVWCGGELPFAPEKAKAHCDKFVMIFSDNDFYVPMGKSLEFAKQLGAKTILERGKGHFCAEDGVVALPSLVTALSRMVP